MRSTIIGIALLLLLPVSGAQAQNTFTKGDIVVESPWSRATPGGADVAAGYLVITNKGVQADRLLSFKTEVAAQPEVHEMSNEGGVMKMRALPKGWRYLPVRR